jgi:hypothetical protein
LQIAELRHRGKIQRQTTTYVSTLYSSKLYILGDHQPNDGVLIAVDFTSPDHFFPLFIFHRPHSLFLLPLPQLQDSYKHRDLHKYVPTTLASTCLPTGSRNLCQQFHVLPFGISFLHLPLQTLIETLTTVYSYPVTTKVSLLNNISILIPRMESNPFHMCPLN